jgi:putative ABC transport system substrate-binding protein
MNTRRQLLAALTLGMLWPAVASRAQAPPRPWRVGFLAVRTRPTVWDIDYYGAFLKGMRDLRYVEGKNFAMEWRFADGDSERLPALAVDLVQRNVDVIVAGGTRAIRAASKATSTIPIVMSNSSDPIGAGFVESLARPGGNITGSSGASTGLSPQHLALLQEAVPKLTNVAVLLNPGSESYSPILKAITEAGERTDIAVLRFEANTSEAIDVAFAAMSRQSAQAVLVAFDGLYVLRRHQIGAQALKYRLPSMFAVREQAEAGGMMSYGQDFGELYRRAANYVDKILRGAKPGELPVEQATKFELVINNKIAKALGVTMPKTLLQRADRIIV